ncbi:MAG: DNA primase [Ferrovibrio sp.]|uniref:DNA primase n=1 Tax=Ferrovibrio sp. TaxID=1917215 RepID=UPI0026055D30|nr:DNA primase [Ferrovibrio sp.]MCW0234682.1 DNA primase [Ferrovibrio sp.]
MAFPDSFLEEIRNRVPLSGVVGRSVRLIKRGREFTGLCPFHNEKSPSFTVNDDKGFFHCFGCGAHGDVIGYVMRNGGLAFPEAVEQLAMEAGLEVPRVRPEDREKADQVATLGKAMEEATRWFQAQLQGNVGSEARAYIQKRGLKPETIERFRMGYAPQSRTALKEALLARGIPEPLLVESGLLIKPEDGGPSYDRFRHRVMFPIGDRRGRVIAFGGRALDPDAPAKYLNSPETPLFHKGRNLYNHAIAREAARESGTVVVVEGYMDVIALAQAGIDHAVAPLGTALTEEQIALLWRLSAEPILCFDGDNAGIRAAMRAADRALPLLEPGHSFRFAILPGGQDPDDLVRAQGRKGMDEVLAAALPMVDILWRKETEGRPLDTPERRAALEAALFGVAGQIRNPAVQGHYRDHFRSRLRTLFAPTRTWTPNRPGFGGGNRPPGPWTRPPEGDKGPMASNLERTEKALLAAVVIHPWLLEEHGEAFAGLAFPPGPLDSLKSRILEEASRHPGLDGEAFAAHLRQRGLGPALDLVTGEAGKILEPFARPDTEPDKVERGWWQAVQRYRLAELEQELAAAEAELASNTNPEAWQRFVALKAEVGSTRSLVSVSDTD